MNIISKPIISQKLRTRLYDKCVDEKNWSEKVFDEALLEFEKFFVLAIHSKGSFLPTTRLVDEIWHECIIETHEYAQMCDRVAKGKFLHHSGIRYDDYASDKHFEDLVSEDLSWVASYCESFGGFTEDSIQYWPFALHMVKTHGRAIDELNAFGKELARSYSMENDSVSCC